MCVGKTLNMDSCSKFWGNIKGIWGNPGEIPHIGWKIPGVYRVKKWLCRPVDFNCQGPLHAVHVTGGICIQWSHMSGV